MRIIGGKYRGQRLFVPRKLTVRPTADRVREAIFNILGPGVQGLRTLDLYAGSGALGLEALSRGAAGTVFVDKSFEALRVIKRNVEALGLKESARTLKIDLFKGLGPLRHEPEPFGLVFMDPPYGKNLIQRTLDMIASSDLAAPDTIVVAEHGSKEHLSQAGENWLLTEERIYGQTGVAFFVKKSRS